MSAEPRSGAFTADVIEFRLTAQADVVSVLRDALKMAENGEIRAVAVAFHVDRRSTGTVYAIGDGDVAHLVCALERLKMRLLELGYV
jgi:hypothetical protein